MSKQGVNKQPIIRYDKENPQFLALKNRISHLYWLNKKDKVPQGFSALIKFGFTHEALLEIYGNIHLQYYKFYNINPGETCEITSVDCLVLNKVLFATRDKRGNFQIILQGMHNKNKFDFQIDQLPIKRWSPINALCVRLSSKQATSSINSYVRNRFKLISSIANTMRKSILKHKFNQGETRVFDKNTKKDLDCSIHISMKDEYRILLETKNKVEPFLRIDTSTKNIWQRYYGLFLEVPAVQFLRRIKQAKTQIEKTELPVGLERFITKSDLLSTYQHMINNPVINKKLADGHSFRIDKKITPAIARTLSVIRQQQGGEFMLMLETKTKLCTGEKDKSLVLGKGTFGKVKPTWRIDLEVPEEWANKVMKNEHAEDAEYEAIFSQNLIVSQKSQDSTSKIINLTSLGELYESKDDIKRSQYSKRAIGDLLQLMDHPTIHLTTQDKARITKNILDAVAVMHAQGKIHQDIKLSNILIYQDQNGYYAKLADFGNSLDPITPCVKPALASGCYESPEISLANEDPNSDEFKYFHGNSYCKNNSYGYQVNQSDSKRNPKSTLAKKYRTPHLANDIWALGILLFHLEHHRFPTADDGKIIQGNPLLKGLLQPNRRNRFTIKKAIKQYGVLKEQAIIQEQASPVILKASNVAFTWQSKKAMGANAMNKIKSDIHQNKSQNPRKIRLVNN